MSGIPDVVICHACGALHFNSDARCPDCRAGLYFQCWGNDRNGKPLQTHAYAAKAYEQEAGRHRKAADQLSAKAAEHAELHNASKAQP